MSDLALSPMRPGPAAPQPGRVERLGDAIAMACMGLAAAALGLIVAVNGANVVGRYFFSRPIPWAEELMLFLMVFTVFAGAAVVTWRQIHIRIDVVANRLPERLGRWAHLLVTVASVLVLATIGWAGFTTVSMLHAFDQRSDALDLPMWIPQSFVAGGMALNAALLILRLFAADAKAHPAGEPP
jgi:TRAP-type C4-dicarboxylate transport system permease small subunit